MDVNGKIEISVRGKWVSVPAFAFDDKTIVIRGKWLRTARVHDEHWLASELSDPETCLRQLRETKPRADLFTFAQLPPGRAPEYHYHLDTDSIAAVRLDNFDRWWQALPQETRKNVRRSERRGVRIEIKPFDDNLLEELVQLNNSSSVRQGRRYTHFGKSFEQVKKDHSSFLDRSDFICSYFENELIGYIKLVHRGRIASILNILSNEAHYDKRPSNLLIKAAVDRCFEKGLTHLTYGFFHYGNKRDTSITQFKIRHGFDELLVPRYYIPLTARGKLSLSLGLNRGLLGLLPNSILTKGVALRAKLYSVSRRLSAGVA